MNMNKKLHNSLLVAFLCGNALSPLCAEEKTLAEDPFALAQQQHQSTGGKPWVNRSPEALRKWAKKNLHHKLTASTVIDAETHPEWAWFRESGLGLFLHWGLASVPPNTGDAWGMVWTEHRAKNNLLQTPEEMFAVADFWNPEKYDPNKWMAAASKAGFGYAVLTTRHHDGYCLWPSEQGQWDSGDKMGGRDLVKEYVEACRNNDIRVGFYYSGPNWHYEYKLKDFSWPPKGYNYKHEKVGLQAGLAGLMGGAQLPGELGKLERQESTGQVRELMTNYGPIDMMWWDGSSIMTPEELAALVGETGFARGSPRSPFWAAAGASSRAERARVRMRVITLSCLRGRRLARRSPPCSRRWPGLGASSRSRALSSPLPH